VQGGLGAMEGRGRAGGLRGEEGQGQVVGRGAGKGGGGAGVEEGRQWEEKE
jgi:hypothetical protein